MDKQYIDENIWVIENFFTEEEISELMKYCLDDSEWYTTMRSVDNLIMNKYLERVLDRDADGNIIQPLGHNEQKEIKIFTQPGGIFDRLTQVLPDTYRPHPTVQSYKPIDDLEVTQELTLDWHWDASHDDNVSGAFVVFINDNFEGGELVFKNKPYEIKPKAGMLVNIPVTEEYTHAVKHTRKNTRHVLYGNCFYDIRPGFFKTTDKC